MPALANSLTWERWYPCAVAVLAAGLGAAFHPDRLPFPPQLLRGTVSLGALAFGFVGVFLAVLVGLDSPFMRRIRRTSYVIVLRRYVGWALLAGLALALVSLAGLLPGGAARPAFAPAWGFALASCLACLHRIGRIRLFPSNDPENSADPPSRPRDSGDSPNASADAPISRRARAADVRSRPASLPREHMSI